MTHHSKEGYAFYSSQEDVRIVIEIFFSVDLEVLEVQLDNFQL